MAWRASLGPLVLPQFRRQFGAYAVSMVGSSVLPVALALGILQSTGSAAELGLVMTAYSLPMAIFFLVGGVWSDRLPRQRVMMAADIARFISQTALGVAIVNGDPELWVMMALQAISGAAAAFFKPAATGLTVLTVDRARLQSANALLSLVTNISGIVGPLLAGVLVTTIGAGYAVMFDGLSFAVSAVFLAFLRLPASTVSASDRRSFLAELREGVAETTARPWVWSSILVFAVFNIVFAVFSVLGPASVASRPGGAIGWAVVVAAMSAGQLAGDGLSLWLRPARPILVMRIGELLILPVIFALALQAPLAVLAVAAFLGGIAFAFPDALWYTALQQQIPENVISRVSALDWAGTVIARPVGYLLVATAAAVTPPVALLIGGGLVAFASLATLMIPDVRNLARRDSSTVPVDVAGGGQQKPSASPVA